MSRLPAGTGDAGKARKVPKPRRLPPLHRMTFVYSKPCIPSVDRVAATRSAEPIGRRSAGLMAFARLVQLASLLVFVAGLAPGASESAACVSRKREGAKS